MIRLSLEELERSPEIAVLVVLGAAYPELHDVPDPDHANALSKRAALSVIDHARAPGAVLARYRRLLLRERTRDDLLPF
jgi:hypothetical protein